MKTFTTLRLLARELSVADSVGFVALKTNSNVTRYYLPEPMTVEQAECKLHALIEDIQFDQSYTYSVFLQESETFIGTIVLWNLQPELQTGEVGYEFLPDYWGNGYAQEILSAFLLYMYGTYGYKVFTACPSANNIASNKVLTACGFVFEKIIENRGDVLNNYRYEVHMDLEITEEVNELDVQRIRDGLLEYNLPRLEDKNPRDLGVFLNDDEGSRIAGLIGYTHGYWLFVKFLWVSEQLRGSHIGSRLLAQAEDTARQRGCRYVFLDTFSFQAPGFYLKQGYQEVFALENFPLTGKRHYFTKNL